MEFKTKCTPGRTWVQQQKQPSSSRFRTGAASVWVPAVTVKWERVFVPGNVPALQIPAVDRSSMSVISRNQAAYLTRLFCTLQV